MGDVYSANSQATFSSFNSNGAPSIVSSMAENMNAGNNQGLVLPDAGSMKAVREPSPFSLTHRLQPGTARVHGCTAHPPTAAGLRSLLPADGRVGPPLQPGCVRDGQAQGCVPLPVPAPAAAVAECGPLSAAGLQVVWTVEAGIASSQAWTDQTRSLWRVGQTVEIGPRTQKSERACRGTGERFACQLAELCSRHACTPAPTQVTHGAVAQAQLSLPGGIPHLPPPTPPSQAPAPPPTLLPQMWL